MQRTKGVPLMLSIPKDCRDRLREMAARENLENMDQVTSASTIAREIICTYLDRVEAGSDNNNKGEGKK
jgi:hypothetical protein